MERLLGKLVRNGLRRGLLGGDKPWLALGAGALVLRLVLCAVRKSPEVVFRENLPAGAGLVISHRGRAGHNGESEGAAPQP
jgi:hypothetical protein